MATGSHQIEHGGLKGCRRGDGRGVVAREVEQHTFAIGVGGIGRHVEC